MKVKLNASSRIMLEEAEKMGISCFPFHDHETILMTKGKLQWYVRGSRTSLQSSVGKTIADYKPLTKEILTHFNMPTAKFVKIDHIDEFEELIATLSFPIVAKPLAERHGSGVVVGIQNIADARNVFIHAHQPLLFEEMLEGTEYRVVCVNYQCIAAAFRKPAHVVGDSAHTIQELINKKNTHPWRGPGHENNLSLITVDENVTSYLKEQNFTLDSIPQEGIEVKLRKTANLSTGGEAWDVSEQVCDENKKLLEEVARICDLNVVGIDVMCHDLKTPIRTQKNSGIIEVNASPGLRMHHYPIQGEPKNIAKAILDMVINRLST